MGTAIKYRALFFSVILSYVDCINNTKNPVLSFSPIFPCPYQYKHINHQEQGHTTHLVSRFLSYTICMFGIRNLIKDEGKV